MRFESVPCNFYASSIKVRLGKFSSEIFVAFASAPVNLSILGVNVAEIFLLTETENFGKEIEKTLNF